MKTAVENLNEVQKLDIFQLLFLCLDPPRNQISHYTIEELLYAAPKQYIHS